MIKVEMKVFVARIQKALSEGNLATYKGAVSCEYKDANGNCCIVGAGLTEEQISEISRWQMSYPVSSLMASGKIEIPERYAGIVTAMQHHHDRSTHKGFEEQRPDNLLKMNEAFYKLKEMLEAEQCS